MKMKLFLFALCPCCWYRLCSPKPKCAPELGFDSVPDFFKLPAGMNFGEVPGVAVNSKGHVFVFTRSNSANGPAYAPAAAQLLEFSANGDYLREIGKGLYAWSEAHSVRIDRDDNIWAIDKGSDMIIKFNPAGRVTMVFGRRAEGADEETKPWGASESSSSGRGRLIPSAHRRGLGFRRQHLHHRRGYVELARREI